MIACYPPSGSAQLDLLESPILSVAGLAIWRAAVAIYLWGLLIYNTTQQKTAGQVFGQIKTLTTQSIILSGVYYSIAAALPIYSYMYPQNEEQRYKLLRILINLQSLCTPLAVTVIFGFWFVIGGLSVLNIHNHGVAGLAMIMDFYICYSRPTLKRLCHGMLLYGVIYAIWSIMWSLSGHHIYPFLNWTDDTVYAMIAMVVLAILSQTSCLLLWFTKGEVVECCIKKRAIAGLESVPPESPEMDEEEMDTVYLESVSPYTSTPITISPQKSSRSTPISPQKSSRSIRSTTPSRHIRSPRGIITPISVIQTPRRAPIGMNLNGHYPISGTPKSFKTPIPSTPKTPTRR